MARDMQNWFGEKEVAIVQGQPELVNAKHRSTYQGRAKEKVNGPFVQILELFPELIDLMDASTKEKFRLQNEPEYLTRAMADMFPDQLPNLIFGLLLSEQKADESTDEFVERFDEVWQEIGQVVRQRIQYTKLSYEIRRSFGTLQQSLFDHIGNHIDVMTELSGVRIRVPRDVFIRWVVAYDWNDEVEYLPDILDAAFAIATNEPHTERATTYWELMSSVASEQGLAPPDRTFDFTNPTDRDYELHERALSALDDELHAASHHYWIENQIQEADRLLALGLLAHNNLIPHDKKVLENIPCSNARDGWGSYDTRRGNNLTNDRDPPILSRETIPKSKTDEQKYTFTEFGEFVYELNEFVEKEDSLETVVYNFIREVHDSQSISEVPTDEVLGDDAIPGSVLWVELMKKTDLFSA